MAVLIDPTAKGKYPVILGDGMLGKTSNDIYTGVRYNHKPSLSSNDAPAHARLKPSLPGKTVSYDLSFTDGGSSYAYAGTRSVDGNQFVLHFDPERQAFILDKIDSTFDMNLTNIPGNTEAAKISRKYPQLDSHKPLQASSRAKAIPTDKESVPPPSKQPRHKVEDKKQKPVQQMQPQKLHQQDMALSLPMPKPESLQEDEDEKKSKKNKKTKKQVVPIYDDEEEDDDDGGLLVEYPGGDNTAAKLTDFSPAFPPPRRFEEFMDQRDSEGDADGETDGELDLGFKLPSPVSQPVFGRPEALEPASPGDAEDDLENDLEKEMQIAFEDLANSQEGSPDVGDESEISEED